MAPSSKTFLKDRRIQGIFEWAQDRPFMAAVLGPAASGKSLLLTSVADEAKTRGWKVACIDFRFARELQNEDEFYSWMADELKQQGLGSQKSGRMRLDFNRHLEAAISQAGSRVLITWDHVDQLTDAHARSLISALRELQDTGSSRPALAKLHCLLSGTISVFELRRKNGSPNLQFKLHVLPDSLIDSPKIVRDYLKKVNKKADAVAVDALVELTRGEEFFLDLLNKYLPKEPTEPNVEDAARMVLKDAARVRSLLLPAQLYQLEPEFMEIVEGLKQGRTVGVPDSIEDISRYQLLGAICINPSKPHEVEFRNGLVRRLLSESAHSPALNPELSLLTELRDGIFKTRSSAEVSQMLGQAWEHIFGTEASVKLNLRASGMRLGFDLSSAGVKTTAPASILHVEQEVHLVVEGIETFVIRKTMGPTVFSTWNANGKVMTVVVTPNLGFTGSIASQRLLGLWSRFLAPLRESVVRVAVYELGDYALAKIPETPRKVFVSSTFLDLAEHRVQIMEQIQRRDLLFRGMEHFGAAQVPSAQFVVEQVRRADVYLGIFARRYGSVDPNSGRSMTELEYDEAVSLGIPRLCYVTHKDATVKSGDAESDPEKLSKLNAFLSKVTRDVVYQFRDIGDLARQVFDDLGDAEKLG